ncbi:multicopper oxidase domain-containing protein [Aquihabitans sp. G128]|uniref:multicopper oxidase domain-containing protein n=1 Tax=Aquihabitans sp. G128 TaxID=2849779 RepID=UPI001C21E9C7|nr:multicopper oxidase domain-containing protein [Aquihabitans sp. G128]QXC61637.1 multicopper oxidase domain-containing protein [Aquihabitans sp. G128]
MSAPNQTLLTRFALAASVFALMIAAVAVSGRGDASGPSATAAAAPVAISLSEFALTPSAVTVPKGGSLAVTNNGSMVHNLSVDGTGLKVADLAAGASSTLDVSKLKPGTYAISCQIAGHEDSGMKGTLVVSDGGTASATEAAAQTEEMAGMDHSNMDVSTMEGSDPEAKAMNERMEKAMTGGVQEFLDYAKRYGAGTIEAGNEKLAPTVLADGTKRFDLTAAITDWEVSPGKVVKAWTYNGRVPGPWLRVEPGDKVEVHVTNDLPISTDVHWHGVSVPNAMDGVAPITQDYIEPYKSFTYAFTAPDHDELGMYHAHMHGQVAIVNGLFAIFQVGDVPLPEGKHFTTMDVPKGVKVAQEIPMVLNDAGVIGLSLNGKAFPETAPIVVQKGDWVLIHFLNEGLQVHPMHLHRQPQLVVAKDGFPLDSPYQADTILIAPGERYSVLVHATEVGTWAFHCHIVSHAESDEGLTGMVTAMIVQ